MALTPYNTNILQALKWQQNKAPNITSLLQQKANWYQQFNTTFWQNWETTVFDLRTAGSFGILIWCIILGVPSQLFGLFGNSRAWAYGPNRQNYVYNEGGTPPPNANLIGGNFAGGGNTTILNPEEAIWALQLRYAALVSNGRIAFVNFMLNWIFNLGEPWDYAGGKWFYVMDSTGTVVNVTGVTLFANGTLISATNYTLLPTGTVIFGAGDAPAAAAVLTASGSWNGTAFTALGFGTGDGTALAFHLTRPVGVQTGTSGPFKIEYRIGPNMGFSSQFINLLNSPQFGITPQFAGSSYTVIVE